MKNEQVFRRGTENCAIKSLTQEISGKFAAYWYKSKENEI